MKNDLDLSISLLEQIETPLSDTETAWFWLIVATGVGIAVVT